MLLIIQTRALLSCIRWLVIILNLFDASECATPYASVLQTRRIWAANTARLVGKFGEIGRQTRRDCSPEDGRWRSGKGLAAQKQSISGERKKGETFCSVATISYFCLWL